MPSAWRRVRRSVLLFVLLGIPAIALAGVGCADRLIMPPVPPVSAGDGSPRVMIQRGDGRVLESFRARSPAAKDAEPRAFVLRFSGDANTAAQWTADRWRGRPVEAWVVNYPGYGGSSGPRTLRALADAALVAHDEMRRVAGDRPIIVEGFSLGTVPALHVAANRPVAGVIVQNPPPLRQVVLRHHGWWNLWLLAGPVALSLPREVDSIANAKRCRARAAFLIAEKDEVIPPALQRDIYDAYAGEKRLIAQRGAGHVAPLDEATMAELHDAMDWMLPPSE
jgi:pimeloyl-ACP methyl ester carboxylesterase